MTRPVRIIRNIAIALASFIVVVVVAVVIIVQATWFQNYVKQIIITQIDEHTGARTEIGSLHIYLGALTAVVNDLVIHGTEPAGTAPLVTAARVQLNIRLFTRHGLWNITYLGIDQPKANVIVFPDGRTNLPTPPTSTSSTSPLQTVVDLAIGRFELTNGLAVFADQKQPLNIRGNDLRAQLIYNTANQDYHGQLSLQPVYIISGRNTPVTFTVNVPVQLTRNAIDVQDANIFSSGSAITINASVKDLKHPQMSARVTGHVALADLKNTADVPLSLNARNVPSVVDLDANATLANNTLNVSGLHITLGQSDISASGSLASGLHFNSRLAMGQLGRLLNQSSLPNETATVSGDATLDAQNNFALSGLRAAALGGEVAGNISFTNSNTFDMHGNLEHFDIGAVLSVLGESRLPYDGVVSGSVNVAGNTKTGLKGLTAQTHLFITPGRRGIPVSGHLDADYNGARDNISIQKSVIRLPHTQLSIDGSVGKQLNIALTTTNLSDLLAALPQKGPAPVTLNGGRASFTGEVTGSLSAPHISGDLTASRFTLEGRQFDNFHLDASASKAGVTIANGSISHNTMQAMFSGTLGFTDWKPVPRSRMAINASLHQADLADLMALAGQTSAGYSGRLNANANITGTFGNPRGSASLVVTNGTIDNQPFDRAQAQVNLTDQLVTIPTANIQFGPGRINLSAQFQHPRDSFTTGHLQAQVQSNEINLAQLTELQKQRPNTSGTLQLQANVTGNLGKEFQVTSVNGNVSLHALQSEGRNYGDLTATANTTGQSVNYKLASDFAGSNIRVDGSTRLAPEYPTMARASVANLHIEPLLAIAGRGDLPIKGVLSGDANFSGTINNPQGSADLTLANGTLYDDPVNRLHAVLNYQPQSIDVPQVELVSGPSHLDFSAHYEHPVGDFESGDLRFRIDSNTINLARIKTLANERPGIGGTLQLNAAGAARIMPSGTHILFEDLNSDINANNLSMNGKRLGDLKLVATTSTGRINVALDSDLAGANIQGRGNLQIANNYSVNARLTVTNLNWAGLRPLLSADVTPPSFNAAGDAQISVNGPLTNMNQLRASIAITRAQVTGASTFFHNASHIVLQNQGPIAATLDRGNIQIQSAHITGPQTDFQASGTVPLSGQGMNVALNGNVNLAVLQQFSQSITSSGSIVLAAGVRGSLSQPRLTGQVRLQKASFDTTSMPVGIWNAQGRIALNGNSAVIQTMTADSGGGQISVNGTATMADTLRFSIQAKATRVRILVQQGMGIVLSASISLAGSTENSLASGTVTVDEVSYASQGTDIGSMLSLAAPPVQTPTAPSPALANMRLDIRVRSSSSLGVQASMAQNVQLTTDLHVRGTAANPGITGRVTITQGKLLFFGSTYTVNTGTIAFYNPIRIDPVLDLSLQTTAQGVTVVLRVTGPVDNMKLSYTSDPPLPFQEILNLLATGTTPTSDPTILANQPALPAQSFEQLGESAIVSQAVAAPVANQLQRVFGISQLKINPAFTSGSALPQTQISLTQQISSNITFTYATGVNTANAETIQAVWTFTPQWSAQALRDYNGIFSIMVQYKRQIH